MMMKRFLRTALFFTVMPLLASCGGGNTASHGSYCGADTVHLKYATNLSITRLADYVRADVRNPWDTTRLLHTYLLVPDSAPLPDNMPEGTVIRTPLRNTLVYSSVHNSLVVELGAPDAIRGVCDPQYIHQPVLARLIASGKVADCGNSMSPNIERIMQLKPDAILLSPFENSGTYGKVGQLGIPIVECADYMETSPLARAEWMKFYGMLYGCESRADSLFAVTEKEYTALRKQAAKATTRPSVLVDRLYGNVWNVPCRQSTMGIFIADAGGRNPFDYIEGSGSRSLSGEQVLHRAGNADIWIVRYSQPTPKTLSELRADNAIYSRFEALKCGKVYGCNTMHVPFYEEVPFHPQWLLANLINIVHPELQVSNSSTQSYFSPMP